MHLAPWTLHEKVAWPHFQQFLYCGMSGFMFAPWMVAIYFPMLKHLLMSILVLLPLWASHISIQTMAMLDLGDILITLGLDANIILLKIWFCFKINLTSLEVRRSWVLPWEKNGMPIILRYDLDWGRWGSSTWRVLISLEFLVYWLIIYRSDCWETLLVMMVMPRGSDWM